MDGKTLSVFVDESGKFQIPDPLSPFYIVGLVFHDQGDDVSGLVNALDADWDKMGYENFCFHAGPLIRKEKGFMFMKREERQAIWARMMLFARKVRFKYRCLVVDKRYVNSSLQIVEKLQRMLGECLDAQREMTDGFQRIKIYYDCGQSPITKLLHDTFSLSIPGKVEFAQAVRPSCYKLFQVADLVCSVKLLEMKLASGMTMTVRESKFFGGARNFRRNMLKQLRAKEMKQ